MLRCEPVVDAHDDHLAVTADQPRLVVVRLDVTDDESAAVEEDHRRDRAVDVRPVDARGPISVSSRHGDVLDRTDLGKRRDVADAYGSGAEAGAGLLDGSGRDRWRARVSEELQNVGDLWV